MVLSLNTLDTNNRTEQEGNFKTARERDFIDTNNRTAIRTIEQYDRVILSIRTARESNFIYMNNITAQEGDFRIAREGDFINTNNRTS